VGSKDVVGSIERVDEDEGFFFFDGVWLTDGLPKPPAKGDTVFVWMTRRRRERRRKGMELNNLVSTFCQFSQGDKVQS